MVKDFDPTDSRKCLFVARYTKLNGQPWRRVGKRPEIETYLNDVSKRYREPRVQFVTPTRVIIRVFDEQAIDLSRRVDYLGDYLRALARCDECFRNEVLGQDEADLDSPLPRCC